PSQGCRASCPADATMSMRALCLLTVIFMTAGWPSAGRGSELRVGTFDVDVTPPIGSPVAYAPTRKIDDPISARGVVLLGAGQPIVLCAVDYLGISNSGYDRWRETLAEAVG